MPIYGVDPNANHALWGLGSPEDGAPATFLVGGQVWRYAGGDGMGSLLYSGYYSGQQLTLGAAAANGQRLVSMTNDGGTTVQRGTLNDVRGSVRLANGTMVYSGSMDGARITPTIDENNLSAIPGNLDIAGNVMTLGSLSGDLGTSGLTLQFSDNGSTALLGQALGRSNAQWIWWRTNPQDVSGHVPVMALDSGWGVALYDPANPTTATIKLNPGAQGSSFKGPLRVAPAGDIDMGEFTNGPQP